MSNWKERGWREDPEPYWDGIVTSEKVLRQEGMFRIVRRGQKRVSERTGKPYGKVLMCYDVDYMSEGGLYAGEWQLESSHPSYESAKEYMCWK
jgi:hypothetical protein